MYKHFLPSDAFWIIPGCVTDEDLLILIDSVIERSSSRNWGKKITDVVSTLRCLIAIDNLGGTPASLYFEFSKSLESGDNDSFKEYILDWEKHVGCLREICSSDDVPDSFFDVSDYFDFKESCNRLFNAYDECLMGNNYDSSKVVYIFIAFLSETNVMLRNAFGRFFRENWGLFLVEQDLIKDVIIEESIKINYNDRRGLSCLVAE